MGTTDVNGGEYQERLREKKRLEALITGLLVEVSKEPGSADKSVRLIKRLADLHEEDITFSEDQAMFILSARFGSRAALSLATVLAQKGFINDAMIQELLPRTDADSMMLLRTALENNRLIHLSPKDVLFLMREDGDNGEHEKAVRAAVNNRLECFFPSGLRSEEIATWMEMRTALACCAVVHLGERILGDPKLGVRGFFVEKTNNKDDGVSYTIYSSRTSSGEAICLVEGRKVSARQLFVGPYTRSLVSDLTAGNPQALAWTRDNPLTSLGQSAGRN